MPWPIIVLPTKKATTNRCAPVHVHPSVPPAVPYSFYCRSCFHACVVSGRSWVADVALSVVAGVSAGTDRSSGLHPRQAAWQTSSRSIDFLDSRATSYYAWMSSAAVEMFMLLVVGRLLNFRLGKCWQFSRGRPCLPDDCCALIPCLLMLLEQNAKTKAIC